MTHNITAAKFAGNNGISTDSNLGLWGTTTRKMKFRISSQMLTPVNIGAPATGLRGDGSLMMAEFNFTNMPAIKRATFVPESFCLTPNTDPTKTITPGGGAGNTGIVPVGEWGYNSAANARPWSSVCLRINELSQPNSVELAGNWTTTGLFPILGTVTQSDHGRQSLGRQSNVAMSMGCLQGDSFIDASDRLGQCYKTWSGNEYDCGFELSNNCFQQNQWTFGLTNEFGDYYQLGQQGDPATSLPTDGNTLHGWYAEFSIVYEPEDGDFNLN